MAEKYLFFNSTQGDMREYQANDIADYWNSFLSTGLISDNGEPQLKVVAEGTNRIIEIQKGRALIDGHLYLNDSTKLKIEEPDALYDRIDRVVIRYDNTIKNRFIKAFVLKGETSENPVPPQLTRGGEIYELSLAQIRVVGGKSFIEQEDIVDERLNEDICGLASSLVSVPTSIFDESFKEYMNKIAMEWQNWFNNVVNDTYVTTSEYKAHNRDVDRQLANLNAIADIDNRAIGNTGKFYDLFDGSNDMSVAKMVEADALLLVDASANTKTLEVSDTNIQKGDEVKILGVTSLLDTEITTYTRIVYDIQGGILILDRTIPTPLLKGASILRSSFKDSNPIKTINVVDWNTTTTSQLYSASTYYNSAVSENGKYLFYAGKIYSINENGTLTYVTGRGNVTSNSDITKDFKYMAEVYVSGTTVNVLLYTVNVDTATTTVYSSTNYTISTSSTGTDGNFPIEIFYKNEGLYVLFGLNPFNGGGSRSLLKFNFSTLKFEHVGTTANLIGGVGFWYNNDAIYYAYQSTSNNMRSLSLRKIPLTTNADGEITAVATWQYIPLNGENEVVTELSSSVKIGNLVTRHEKTGKFVISFSNRAVYIFNPKNDSIEKTLTFDTNTGGSVVLSDDMSFALAQSGIYVLKEGVYRMLKVNSNVAPMFINRNVAVVSSDVASGTVTSVKPSIKTYAINGAWAYYTFNQPIKNLAGWLFAKETPTAIKAELSLVDQDENENFKELAVTQNENEYEFLETENLYLKDKATLKLTIEGGSLDKLLGGIE